MTQLDIQKIMDAYNSIQNGMPTTNSFKIYNDFIYGFKRHCDSPRYQFHSDEIDLFMKIASDGDKREAQRNLQSHNKTFDDIRREAWQREHPTRAEADSQQQGVTERSGVRSFYSIPPPSAYYEQLMSEGEEASRGLHV